jgi:hypothetical protein
LNTAIFPLKSLKANPYLYSNLYLVKISITSINAEEHFVRRHSSNYERCKSLPFVARNSLLSRYQGMDGGVLEVILAVVGLLLGVVVLVVM